MKKEIPLVVTTLHKGVFFGYGEPKLNVKNIRLTNVRMCVYWSSDIKGVLGLAASGPNNSCKVTPSVPSMILNDVTGIMECSDAAKLKWESGPWA